jgi:dCTP deaminase
MILNDRQITDLAERGMIAPFAPMAKRGGVISYGVTSFGYDMRVADEWIRYVGEYSTLDPKHVTASRTVSHRADAITLDPGDFVLCRSVEHFAIPEDVMVVVVGKSTYARCGIIVNVTPLEPGWTGHVTIELSNTNTVPVVVYANEGIAQCLFYHGERPAVTYADKQGKYQGQSGVVLPRVD